MSFNPSQKLVIDATGKGLAISCPFWANDLVRDLPNRRWNRSARVWMVPLIKQNVERVLVIASNAGVEMTDGAKKAIDAYLAQASCARGAPGSQFPSWYKYKTEPRKHQAEALNKGYGLKAYGLFLPMQTGKSKTAIDLSAAHRMEGNIKAVLVFCKLTLRKNWSQQFQLHCPIPYSMYLPATEREAEFTRWLQLKHDFKVMVVGWESLSQGGMKDLVEQFMLVYGPKVAVIGDEVTYIANSDSDRSERAYRLAHMGEYRYALTGTPAIEGPMNLYGIFEFLDTNIIGLGDFYAFRNRYAIMGGYMREVAPGKKIPTKIVGYQQLDELVNLIAPYTYQRKKEDIIDLPPKRRQLRTPQITKAQRDAYDAIRKEGVIKWKGGERAVQNVLEVMLRLHQVTGGWGVKPYEKKWTGVDGEPKVKTLYEPFMLVKPEANPKMIDLMDVVQQSRQSQGIIWVVYRHEIDAICQLLRAQNLRYGELHGGVKEFDRQPIVDEFQRGNLQWMVANASTGGMGYTMMASEVNVFYNNTFKAIDREQAEDRAWGEGQTKSGIWIDIAAERTVDNTILAALGEKKDLSEYVRERMDRAIELLSGE